MGNPQKSRLEPEVAHQDTASTPKQRRGQTNNAEPNTSNDKPAGQAPISRLDAAFYIHEMAIELRALAETAKFSFLAYLLELVIEESAAHKRERL